MDHRRRLARGEVGLPDHGAGHRADQLALAAEVMGLDEATHELLRWPMREFHVRIPVKMDDGTTRVFEGFRVQYNDARGPTKGGLRFHPAETFDTVRALAAWVGRELRPGAVSRLVYEVEKLHHGTPSGIDNTVVAFGRPVYFVRGQPIETFGVGAALHLLVADTGIYSSTRVAVGETHHRDLVQQSRH